MTKLIFTVLILSCFQGARADTFDNIVDVLPSAAQGPAQVLMNALPSNQRQGISDYLEAIGANPSRGMNSSIQEFNYRIMSNGPCITDLAGKFYYEINREDFDFSRANKTPFFNRGLVSLDKDAKSFGKKEGWLWEKALSYSKGDKLLAMQLIGICGHDDKMQLSHKLGTFGFKVSERMQKELENLEPSRDDVKAVAHQEAMRDKDEDSSFEEKVEKNKRYLDDKFAKTKRDGVSCPMSNSAFFGPRALGAEADIPDDLRSEIAKIQAPTQGAASLPGKNYHIMGAAYTSCLLLRRGVPSFIAKKMVIGAIDAYRSTRICERLEDWREGDSQTPNFGKVTSNQIFDKIKVLRMAPDDSFCSQEDAPKDACDLAGNFFEMSTLRDKDITDEILKAKIARRIAVLNVSTFFKSTAYSKRSNNCKGPQLGSAVRDFLEYNRESGQRLLKRPCPSSLSKENCNEVRKLLDTYYVDFKWSEAQHLAGFEFARKNCPAYNPANTPEMAACKALGRPNSAQGQSSEYSGVK